MEWLTDILTFDSSNPLLFTQTYFWVFFAAAYVIFALLMELPFAKDKTSRMRLHLRNVYLLLVSWLFYYKTSGYFLAILLFITFSDWLLALLIHRSNERGHTLLKRLWLTLSVVIDLSILAYFKYAYFGVDMVNQLLGTHLTITEKILLPIGISFYIFQVISYTTDVYHQRIEPVRNILDFGFYVSFFPQLVAGPIVRASEFVPQLYKPFFITRRQFGIAVFWILNGLSKKIILSDYLATNFIDRVFDNPLLFSGFENFFALFAYSLQVYADFSGYTDIAIGVAMLLGFYLPKNFDSPYKSRNPQEFWRRWHMALSRWLKTYLYIPLGGNRTAGFGTYFWIALIAVVALVLTHNQIVTIVFLALAVIVALVAWLCPSHRKLLYANLNSFITMILGGLWHGASWNFMIWGGLNGAGMIVNKIWREVSCHWRLLLLALVTGVMWWCDYYLSEPLWHMLKWWSSILMAGMVITYVYRLCVGDFSKKEYVSDHKWINHISNAWAVVQTFAFITFTRLFFRSGSNLDPATANQEAWRTAKEMVNQIGGAWNSQIIVPFLLEYRVVVLIFVVGMIIHWLPDRYKRWYRLNFASLPLWVIVLLSAMVIAVLYQFITADVHPFIYFQF